MNTFKTILLSSLTLLSLQNIKAQTMKEPVSFKLKNGMNVIVSENSQSAMAYSSFTLDGSAFENRKDGVLELFIAMLNESSEQENIKFTGRSGKLATVKDNINADLTAMSNKIKAPKIDELVFDSAKAKLIANIKADKSAYDQSVNEKSISALSLSDVVDFSNQIAPEKTYLTVAGNIDLATAKNAVKKAFGDWPKVPVATMQSEISK